MSTATTVAPTTEAGVRTAVVARACVECGEPTRAGTVIDAEWEHDWHEERSR